MQALRRRVSARPKGARRAHVAHSLCVTGKRSKGCNRRTGRSTDVETALAALNEDNDTEMEETDIQQILLAYKEERQLCGKQTTSEPRLQTCDKAYQ